MNYYIIASVLSMLVACPAYAHEPEAYYQRMMCEDIGVMEYMLDDDTRIDCLTDGYAWEVDFQEKWAEAIGQCLHYASKTGRHPAIYLIGDNVEKYAKRIMAVSNRYNLGIHVKALLL